MGVQILLFNTSLAVHAWLKVERKNLVLWGSANHLPRCESLTVPLVRLLSPIGGHSFSTVWIFLWSLLMVGSGGGCCPHCKHCSEEVGNMVNIPYKFLPTPIDYLEVLLLLLSEVPKCPRLWGRCREPHKDAEGETTASSTPWLTFESLSVVGLLWGKRTLKSTAGRGRIGCWRHKYRSPIGGASYWELYKKPTLAGIQGLKTGDLARNWKIQPEESCWDPGNVVRTMSQ